LFDRVVGEAAASRFEDPVALAPHVASEMAISGRVPKRT